ncbi:MAG: zeta toxin family protein [Deltaproteobacteria bacterium]|nr:zeta toxin family protein [Deltaproteobacteria bacterium]MDQ3297400.1 zeta toxin family protein [Myxococcota bacterium]
MKPRTPPPASQLVILTGPNGAGQSTFYEVFLKPSRLPFLNADVIEAKTGIASVEVARILDAMRDQLIERGHGFITETVFSDPVGAKLAMLRKAVDAGYDVTLIYIAVEPALSALRIDQRLAFGGHDVPRDRIASRFERSLVNLQGALRFVPLVKLYDNSSIDEPYRLLAIFEAGQRTFVAPGKLPRWAAPIVRPRTRRAPRRKR